MGTSKSYLPKVTQNTTRTKINITNLVKTGGINDPTNIAKVISPFKHSLENDPSGIRNGNYASALSKIGSVLSLGAGNYIDRNRDVELKEEIKTPNDLFNRIIVGEDYLSELEKANLLRAIGETLGELGITDFDQLDKVNCNTFFLMFLKELIYAMFVASYFEHIREKTNNSKEAHDFCHEIEKYIEAKLLQNKGLVVDLMNNENRMKEYVGGLLGEALSLL